MNIGDSDGRPVESMQFSILLITCQLKYGFGAANIGRFLGPCFAMRRSVQRKLSPFMPSGTLSLVL